MCSAPPPSPNPSIHTQALSPVPNVAHATHPIANPPNTDAVMHPITLHAVPGTDTTKCFNLGSRISTGHTAHTPQLWQTMQSQHQCRCCPRLLALAIFVCPHCPQHCHQPQTCATMPSTGAASLQRCALHCCPTAALILCQPHLCLHPSTHLPHIGHGLALSQA